MEHAHPTLLADPKTWVGIAFLVFFLIFGAKIGKALNAMLDRRSAAIRAELEEAARLRTEAEAMLRSAQARREAALREAEEVLARARVDAARLTEAARQEAEHASLRRERLALDRIAAAEKAAVTQVRQAAADIASRAAGQVIANGFGAEADATLVNQAISGLPAALAGRRAA